MSDVHRAVFTSLGLLSTAQEVAGATLSDMTEADPELVAEETLCFVSVAAARSIEALTEEGSPLASAVMAAPFLYRDYMVGIAMIDSGDPDRKTAGAQVGRRLEQKMAFYASHLPPAQAPGQNQIYEKMLLWMGRISPPKMPESPEARLDRTGVVPRVSTFVSLVAAHVRHGQGSDQ